MATDSVHTCAAQWCEMQGAFEYKVCVHTQSMYSHIRMNACASPPQTHTCTYRDLGRSDDGLPQVTPRTLHLTCPTPRFTLRLLQQV